LCAPAHLGHDASAARLDGAAAPGFAGTAGGLDRQVEELDQSVSAAARADARARLLMTQPGVGPVTALNLASISDESIRGHRGVL